MVTQNGLHSKTTRPTSRSNNFWWFACTAVAVVAVLVMNRHNPGETAQNETTSFETVSPKVHIEEVTTAIDTETERPAPEKVDSIETMPPLPEGDPRTQMDHGAIGAMTPGRAKPIQQISILGERNSGTRWIYSHIGQCFNHTLGVKRYLTRYKHWFQYQNATKYPHDTLVIAQFRNPYDWLERMQTKPHHAPAHIGLRWKEFLEKAWTMERQGLDLTWDKNVRCQEDFYYNDVVSCSMEPLPKESFEGKLLYSEHQPLYELKPDGSGEPFANIMEMRSAKIRNFLDVRNYAGIADVWVVQYEYLLAEGTEALIKKIEEWTGIKRMCEPFEPQPHRPHQNLSRTFARYLNRELDWYTESLIGYSQEQVEGGSD